METIFHQISAVQRPCLAANKKKNHQKTNKAYSKFLAPNYSPSDIFGCGGLRVNRTVYPPYFVRLLTEQL